MQKRQILLSSLLTVAAPYDAETLEKTHETGNTDDAEYGLFYRALLQKRQILEKTHETGNTDGVATISRPL